MLLVLEERLTVDGGHEIGPGDFLIFSSARPYVFANAGPGVLRFVRNVVL